MPMAIPQAILVGLIMMVIVFLALVALWGCVRIASYVIQLIERRNQEKADSKAA